MPTQFDAAAGATIAYSATKTWRSESTETSTNVDEHNGLGNFPGGNRMPGYRYQEKLRSWMVDGIYMLAGQNLKFAAECARPSKRATAPRAHSRRRPRRPSQIDVMI